ncbi:MAG: carboxypeptidase regulatory-like domain-containing protein, partial [Planctomycetota bacterium]
VTAKIITAAAVVAIGVGAVVTYKHVAKPTESRPDSFEVTSMPERQPEEKIEIAEDTAEQKLNADVDNQLAESPVEIERQADMKLSDSKSEMTINIESPNDTEGMLDFFVINKETKLPMENVDLNIRINRKKSKGSTENQGLCRIDTVGESINYIRITANAKGYVPMQVTYRAEDDVIDIPSKYTLLLEQGTSIGGFIKNDNHEPIKEAKVYLLVPGGDEIERVAIWDHRVETDSNGFWQCDIMPAKLDDILIRLAHPDYIDDVTYGATEKPSMEKLRKMMGVMIMKKGVTITGTVTDTNGQLVKNALVAQGSDRFGSHYPKTRTDVEGNFSFANVEPGEMILTVQAKGYAPDLKEIMVGNTVKPIEFRLGSGYTIKGRVVDSRDKPVPGAFVAADTWRGHRSLKWRVNTDSEGCFEWNSAPADEVLIDIGKQGYMSVRHYAVVPSDEEYLIAIYTPFRISGSVVDADTNEPISEFKLLTGYDWGKGGPPYWDRRRTKTFTSGQYQITFGEPRDGYLVRVEADGYSPGVSPILVDDEDKIVYDFRLEKGLGINGTVLTREGQKVAGAEVYLCTPTQGLSLENNRNRNKETQSATTGTDGQFSFPPQNEEYLLVILHEDGYVEVTPEDLEKSFEMKLEPWGRVEGTFYVGSKPGVNEKITLYHKTSYEQSAPRYFHMYDTKTDSDGFFVFEAVPAGDAHISRQVKLSRWRTSSTHNEQIEIKSGETVIITLGGKGRAVIGQLLPPSSIGSVSWDCANARIGGQRPDPATMAELYAEIQYPRPERFDEMTVAEVLQWHKDWVKSEEGQALHKEMQRKIEEKYGYSQTQHYSVLIQSDGCFKADDVEAGRYVLTAMLYEKDKAGQTDYSKTIANVAHEFVIPELAEGDIDVPMEL